MPPRLPIPHPHTILPTLSRNHTSPFSTTSTQEASILFALSALSNSRETQHFNKITRLPRAEHSPPLKLIQTGEVDPFPLPDQPATKQRIPRRQTRSSSVIDPWAQRATATAAPTTQPLPTATATTTAIPPPPRPSDDRLRALGLALLSHYRRRTSHLRRTLAQSQRRAAKRSLHHQQDRFKWEREREWLRGEVRGAGVWIVALVGVGTGVGVWASWPGTGRRAFEGRAGGLSEGTVGAGVKAVPPVVVAVGEKEVGRVKEVVGKIERGGGGGAWWRGLFWKQ